MFLLVKSVWMRRTGRGRRGAPGRGVGVWGTSTAGAVAESSLTTRPPSEKEVAANHASIFESWFDDNAGRKNAKAKEEKVKKIRRIFIKAVASMGGRAF